MAAASGKGQVWPAGVRAHLEIGFASISHMTARRTGLEPVTSDGGCGTRAWEVAGELGGSLGPAPAAQSLREAGSLGWAEPLLWTTLTPWDFFVSFNNGLD